LSGHIYVSLYCLKSQNTKVSMVIFVATFLPQNDKNLRGTIFYYNSFPYTIKKEPMPVRKNGRQRGAVSRAIAERCDKNACVLPIKIGFRVAESAVGRSTTWRLHESRHATDEREMRAIVHVYIVSPITRSGPKTHSHEICLPREPPQYRMGRATLCQINMK
jgi:hypothetical protein